MYATNFKKQNRKKAIIAKYPFPKEKKKRKKMQFRSDSLP